MTMRAPVCSKAGCAPMPRGKVQRHFLLGLIEPTADRPCAWVYSGRTCLGILYGLRVGILYGLYGPDLCRAGGSPIT
jgi:hypothetical protein